MKYRFPWIVTALAGLMVLAWTLPDRSVTATLPYYGTPEVQSMGALAFGPENLLLVGDTEGASVFALDVQDEARTESGEPVNVQDVGKKIAAQLGTTADAVRIHDMAVHPASQHIYLSVSRAQGGGPILLRMDHDGMVEPVPLENIRFTRAAIGNAPAADATDQRGRSLRTNAITDLAYADGQVYVAGLSNEEFASNLRRLPFPFDDRMQASSLEIFHVSHGQYETHAPVRTFMPFRIGGAPYILAAYTCTPLVAFPVGDLRDGAHVKGKTVAELGAGNAPLDILSFGNEGEERILVANSNRTVMMIHAADLPAAENLTEPIGDRFGTAGVAYTALPMVGVLEMDMLNDEYVLFLQRQAADGSLQLRSYPTSRL